jgi:hypothetical protein
MRAMSQGFSFTGHKKRNESGHLMEHECIKLILIQQDMRVIAGAT